VYCSSFSRLQIQERKVVGCNLNSYIGKEILGEDF
jgi:hypothetical protein